MHFSKLFAGLACVTLGACAGAERAVQYNDIAPAPVVVDGNNWRIYDKPAEGRLMIIPSAGRELGQGLFKGLTLGAADTDIPKPDYEIAVRQFFQTAHRNCTITDGYKIQFPEWEFTYRCI